MEEEEKETIIEDEDTGGDGETEPCDPRTMSCNEMRDKILSIADQKQENIDRIAKLEKVKGLIDEDVLGKSLNDLQEKNKSLDMDLKDTLDSFMECSLTPKPKDEEKEDEIPLSE